MAVNRTRARCLLPDAIFKSMIIQPGTRLGRYEIRSPLGRGGMGEVYLAEDVRLGRREEPAVDK